MEAAHSQHLVGQDEDRIDWRAGLGQGLDKRGAFVIVPPSPVQVVHRKVVFSGIGCAGAAAPARHS